MTLDRKQFLKMAGAAALTASVVSLADEAKSLISRIKIATIGAPEVDSIERLYTERLGYKVVEKSIVSKNVAASWGAPNAAGQPCVLMQPATGEDVYIRAVGIERVYNYRPMTTWGWNAFEVIVNDVDDLHERLKGSAFRHIGGPANLGGAYASIRAAQYVGPAEEVLYFNCETGDRTNSNLPDPGEDVGRANIMILVGQNANDAMAFYADAFGMPEGYAFETPIGVVSRAQALPEDKLFVMGFSRLRESGNAIEFDTYPAETRPRPRARGHLPPGNAMATFSVDDLDAVNASYISTPHMEYGSNRAATFVGPAGELVELIEDAR